MKKDEADAKSVCLIFAFMGHQSVSLACQLRQGIPHLVIPSEAEGSSWQEGKQECEIGGEKEALPRCMGRQVSCQAVEPSGKKTVVQGGFLGCARNDDTGGA